VFLGENENNGENERTDVSEHPEYMQQFVADISEYAKALKPGFIIIPQNAEELAFSNINRPARGFNELYINAIDGIGIEELFYDRVKINDKERLDMLKMIKNEDIRIMVSDYVYYDEDLSKSVALSLAEGFIAFPRSRLNYDYVYIPDAPPENIIFDNEPVFSLSAAKNYLYLIGTERYKTKTAMIEAISKTQYDVILIDLFFNGVALTKADIAQLKKKAYIEDGEEDVEGGEEGLEVKEGGERLVISYISIGSAEDYRYYWKSGWKKGSPSWPSWLWKEYEGYPHEYWVVFWDTEWQDIIFGNDGSYIKKIIDAGFDGAYLDNVEAYYSLVHDD